MQLDHALLESLGRSPYWDRKHLHLGVVSRAKQGNAPKAVKQLARQLFIL